jgi:hypothetical protein
MQRDERVAVRQSTIGMQEIKVGDPVFHDPGAIARNYSQSDVDADIVCGL